MIDNRFRFLRMFSHIVVLSFTEKDFWGVGLGEILSCDDLLAWFDKTVDDVYDDEETLKIIVSFLLQFALFAAPKDQTFTKVKADQVNTYDEDPAKEIANEFTCLIEFLTKSDMAWCTWQYYNSVPDWDAKKNQGVTGKHTLKSRFTGDKHCRYQPEENSEGMKLYKRMMSWYSDFKAHQGFTTKAQRLCNELAKKYKLIPTYSVEFGPKKTIHRHVDPDSDVEAPVVDLSDTDEGVDSTCFLDYVAESKSRFSHNNSSRGAEEDED